MGHWRQEMPRVIKIRGSREEVRHPRWPIFVILLVAAAVRLAGIGYGLPYYSLHPEEQRIMNQAFSLTNAAPKPARFDKPVFMSYILAGEYGAVYGLGNLTKKFNSTKDFEAYFRGKPRLFITLARLTSLLLALLSIFLLYIFASEIFEWTTGVAAAAFITVLPQHVYFSGIGTGDMLAFLFIVGGLYCLLKLAVDKRLATVFLAALFFGFAAAAEYEYIPLIVIAYAVYLIVVPRDYRLSAFIAGLPMMAVSFAFAFLLVNGILFIEPAKFLSGIETTLRGESGILALAGAGSVLATLKTLVVADVFSSALGWGLVGAGALGILLGLALAKYKRTLFLILLVVLALSAVLFYPIDRETYARWALLLALPLALGAGTVLERLFWKTWMPAIAGMALIVIALLAIAAQPAVEAGVATWRNAEDDTRYQFAVWGAKNLPDGAYVVATANAQFLLDWRFLRIGDETWTPWRTDILNCWNNRSYRLEVIAVPPRDPVPSLESVNYVAVDSWSVEHLKALGTPEAQASLSLVDAARSQGKVIKTFDEPKPGLKGFGPAIEVIELPGAPPLQPPQDTK
jgi:hypothetical protein